MRAHKHVLGPYYVTPDKSLLIQKRHEQHATVKARLFRTRLAVASETEQRERLNEAQMKNLTGGDPINARRMREDEWEFEPTHSLWLQTNHPPEIHGSDTGIWSRIKIVPWTETFNGHTDPNLDANLAAEAAGILNWIIAGCLQWQEDGLNEPEAVIRATLDYRDSEDVLARYADDTGFTFSKSGSVADSELKKNIAEWAYDEGVDKPDAKKVNAWMKAHGCRSKSGRYKRQDGTPGRGKIWKGARFSRPEDEPSKPAEIHGTAGESAHPVTSVTTLPVQQLEDASYETNRHSGDTGDKSAGNVDTATPTGGNEEQGDRLTCPRCGEVPKAIYPSGFCGDCDAAEVAP